jgi:hypothetical protein
VSRTYYIRSYDVQTDWGTDGNYSYSLTIPTSPTQVWGPFSVGVQDKNTTGIQPSAVISPYPSFKWSQNGQYEELVWNNNNWTTSNMSTFQAQLLAYYDNTVPLWVNQMNVVYWKGIPWNSPYSDIQIVSMAYYGNDPNAQQVITI